jgi:N-acetylneuraminic acid mutarotase
MKPRYHFIGALFSLLLATTSFAQQWSKQTNIPVAGLDAAVSFTIGTKVYFGGGSGSLEFNEFDPATGKWTKKSNLPGVGVARGFGVGFSIGDKGYVGLGTDISTDNKITYPKKDLWQYDPATDHWTRKADLPGPERDGAVSFVVNGKAYVGGGAGGTNLYSDFYEYDPVVDVWVQKGDLPTGGLIFPVAFTIGKYAYLTTGETSAEMTDMFRYNSIDDTWDTAAAFPGAARQCAVACAINGKGYVGFGQSSYKTIYGDMFAYDPVKNTWAKVGLPSAAGRAWSTATAANNKMYVGSGWDFSNSFFNDWWSFDPVASGVEQPKASGAALTVYPNPATTAITLELPKYEGRGLLTISDGLGRIVHSENLTSAVSTSQTNKMRIEISTLASGEYFLSLHATSGNFMQKIVKN